MRVEVLEPTKPPEDPTRTEGLPLETIRIVPFVVGTDIPLSAQDIEAQLEPVWIACNMQPLASVFSCLPARLPLKLSDIPDCETADLSTFDPMATGLPSPPNPCRLVDGTPGQPEMQIPLALEFLLGGDLEITMIGHHPGEGDTATCASAILGQESEIPDACILSSTRAAVGPDAELTQLAIMFGLDQGFDLGPVPDPIPDPDHNPQIVTFTVAVLDADDNVTEAVELSRGDTLLVKAGDRIEIVTEANEDGLQTYVIPKDTTEFDDKTELYEGAWFRTWGTLLSNTSGEPRSLNTWTMLEGPQDSSAAAPDGRATLYYVLRDDRQGVDWWWFHVEITP